MRGMLVAMAMVLVFPADVHAEGTAFWAPERMAYPDRAELAFRGDKLSGRVVAISDKGVEFETAYGATITLAPGAIAVLVVADGRWLIDAPPWIPVVLAGETAMVESAEAPVEHAEPGPPTFGDPVGPARDEVAWMPGGPWKDTYIAQGDIAKSSGNTDRERYALFGKAVYETFRDRLTLETDVRFAEDEGNTTEDMFQVSGKYDRLLARGRRVAGVRRVLRFLPPDWYTRTYVYATGAFEQDDIKEVERTTGGLGLGYTQDEDYGTILELEAGVSVVVEEFEAGAAEDDAFAAWRWRVLVERALFAAAEPGLFRWQWPDGALYGYHSHTGLAGFEGEDLLVDSETGLKLRLNSLMSLKAYLEFDYDESPGFASDGDRNDRVDITRGARLEIAW